LTNKTLAYVLVTFALSVSFSTGATFWVMHLESQHSGQLFNMMVKPPAEASGGSRSDKAEGLDDLTDRAGRMQV
jgi:hypothetical protein